MQIKSTLFPIENSTTVDERLTGKSKKNIIKENVHVLFLKWIVDNNYKLCI